MRILITGGTGFIGQHAVAALADTEHELAIVSRNARPDEGRTRFVRIDLLDPEAPRSMLQREPPTHLLHLAWETAHGHYWTAPENTAWADATCRLLTDFFEYGGVRAVAIGTCAEYDWMVPGKAALSEYSARLSADTAYARAKLSAYEHAEKLRASGASVAWCRLFFPYGRFEPAERFIPAVTRALIQGEPAKMTNGRQARDFMAARDVGQALAAVLAGDVSGAINISSGFATPLIDVAREIGRALNREHLLRPGALPGRPGDPAFLAGDNRRLATEVGFTPRITLPEGIADAVTYWRGELQQTAR